MHIPVLLKEVIEWIDVKPGSLYIDATVGEGGHLLEILNRGGKVLGIDLDKKQLMGLRVNELTGLKVIEGNFANIEKITKENNFFPVDGILFDLGLSLKQIEESGRGFSFKKLDEPLDMRISSKSKVTAKNLVNNLSREELYEIFTKNSEEINSWPIANAIVGARKVKKIETVGDLIRVIDKVLKKHDERVSRRIFQSLRIAINCEFQNLRQGLEGAIKILKKEGRILVISFHSLEDRIVKNFVKEKNLRFLTKKPIIAKDRTGFERSAKLRVIEL